MPRHRRDTVAAVMLWTMRAARVTLRRFPALTPVGLAHWARELIADVDRDEEFRRALAPRWLELMVDGLFADRAAGLPDSQPDTHRTGQQLNRRTQV